MESSQRKRFLSIHSCEWKSNYSHGLYNENKQLQPLRKTYDDLERSKISHNKVVKLTKEMSKVELKLVPAGLWLYRSITAFDGQNYVHQM